MNSPKNLEDSVDITRDSSVFLAGYIDETNEYPDRVEEYNLRAKILEEMKGRAKTKRTPLAYSLATICAEMMNDSDGVKQLRADYAKSGLVGRVITSVQDYITLHYAIGYTRITIHQVVKLPKIVYFLYKCDKLIRESEKWKKELYDLLPEDLRPSNDNWTDLMEATKKHLDIMADRAKVMAEKVGMCTDEKLREIIDLLPEEYKPAEVNYERVAEALGRYYFERPDEFAARATKNASGKWAKEWIKEAKRKRKEMEAALKRELNSLPEEYRPEVVTMETLFEATKRYMKEEFNLDITDGNEKASGK